MLVCLLCAAVAAAYVLPGGAILRRMVNARDELRLTTLRVDGTVSFYGGGVKEAASALNLSADKGETQADASFYLRVPGRCRVEASTPEGGKLSAVENNGRKKAEGPALEPLNVALHAVCMLLAARGSSEQETRAELDRQLRGLGVDVRATGLGRIGDAVAYVLGRTGQPQFWVFKDVFQPARLRFSDAQKVAWDVRFLDYSAPSAGELFPRVIEVSRNGERLLRFTVLKADTRVGLADRLFQVTP